MQVLGALGGARNITVTCSATVTWRTTALKLKQVLKISKATPLRRERRTRELGDGENRYCKGSESKGADMEADSAASKRGAASSEEGNSEMGERKRSTAHTLVAGAGARSQVDTLNPLDGHRSDQSIRIYVVANEKEDHRRQQHNGSRRKPRASSVDMETARMLLIRQSDTVETLTSRAAAKLKIKRPDKAYWLCGEEGILLTDISRLSESDKVVITKRGEEFYLKRVSSLRFTYGVFGAAEVGKTSIIERYIHHHFLETTAPTLTNDEVMTTRNISNCPVRIRIVDTAGLEPGSLHVDDSHKQLINRGLGLDAAILVFKLGDKSSLDSLSLFLKAIRQPTTARGPVIVVAGNMSEGDNKDSSLGSTSSSLRNTDLSLSIGSDKQSSSFQGWKKFSTSTNSGGGSRNSSKEGMRFAKKNSALYVEVSAKTGKNIEEVFESVTKKVLRKCQGETAAAKKRLTQQKQCCCVCS